MKVAASMRRPRAKFTAFSSPCPAEWKSASCFITCGGKARFAGLSGRAACARRTNMDPCEKCAPKGPNRGPPSSPPPLLALKVLADLSPREPRPFEAVSNSSRFAGRFAGGFAGGGGGGHTFLQLMAPWPMKISEASTTPHRTRGKVSIRRSRSSHWRPSMSETWGLESTEKRSRCACQGSSAKRRVTRRYSSADADTRLGTKPSWVVYLPPKLGAAQAGRDSGTTS
mmetsp:Transcript_60989/g.137933  ORF Transcript_60989/g.137933 Transcript_60989/m.137933 type:complete len:227 (-) Transcript_60989:619-1299(-)